ncbi:hypothetical protein AVEN_83432-1 [Araneus ventricosus]|uniref:RNase H type-1 domain-containing protein n=1 Tax=Araneus ventricosus TaxID=182803 RepID=A0A4Y2PM21_ARAVE|nr:hypothetical protein AVEN_83432-1 [Araneus ventricosus]
MASNFLSTVLNQGFKPEILDDNIFEVYKDGSKLAGGVGFSVCILNKEIQQKTICHKLEPNNTVFQAELAALGVDADWANSNLPPSVVNEVVKILEDETIIRSNLKSVSDVYSWIEEYGRTLNKIYKSIEERRKNGSFFLIKALLKKAINELESEIPKLMEFIAFNISIPVSEVICESWGSTIDKIVKKDPPQLMGMTQQVEQLTKECSFIPMVHHLPINLSESC